MASTATWSGSSIPGWPRSAATAGRPDDAPLSGSPALDAGSNTLAIGPQGSPLTTDQRGLPRTVNGTVDIGAVERQVEAFTVTTTSASGSGSLAAAVTNANADRTASTVAIVFDAAAGHTSPRRRPSR